MWLLRDRLAVGGVGHVAGGAAAAEKLAVNAKAQVFVPGRHGVGIRYPIAAMADTGGEEGVVLITVALGTRWRRA